MKIAITGGIGSGKSYVCRILEKQGIKVYDCDAEAKRLMRYDADLQESLKQLVGEEVYSAEGILQKPVLAQFLLASEANKQAVNDVVHPAVASSCSSTPEAYHAAGSYFGAESAGMDRCRDAAGRTCCPRRFRNRE